MGSNGHARLHEERLGAIEPYEIIENPIVGQEHRLLERGEDDDGAFLRYEVRFRADATSFTEHLHPKSAETFKVLEGELWISIEQEERSLGPGEEVTLAAGVPHTHRPADGVDTRVLSEVRPPLATESLLRGLAALARDGNTDDEGTPNLLPLSVFGAANPDLVYLSSPPVLVQKLLFRLLAPVGRLRGYPAEYPPPPEQA